MKRKITNRTVKSITPCEKPYEITDTDLPGFLVRVQPSGVATFYARYRLREGGQGRVKIGRVGVDTVAWAREEAKQALASVTQGVDPAEAKRAAKAHTLGSFLGEIYGPWVTTHKKDGQGTLARLQAAFKPLLGKKLGKLNPWLIEKWRTARTKDGKSVVTINRDLAALKSCLNWATKNRFLPENPLKDVRLAKQDRSPRVRYLEPDERQRLYEALDAREEKLRADRDSANQWREARGHELLPDLRTVACADHLKVMVEISLRAGLRRGELFGLKWGDINFQQAVLTVKGENTKTGKARHVPMNSTVVAVLKAWREQNPSAEDALVFIGKHGGRFDNCNSSWRRVLKKAGISNFRWHDQRHDFASRLVMAGVPLNDVRELLGHSSLDMTLRYAHLGPKATAAAVEHLAIDGDNVVPFPANGHQA